MIKKGINIKCKYCNKIFYLPKSRIKQNIVYCSRFCKHNDSIVQKICIICNNKFEIYKCYKNRIKTCSKKCANKYISILYKDKKFGSNLNGKIQQISYCRSCGKVFPIKPSHVAKGKNKYCSINCYHNGKHISGLEKKLYQAMISKNIYPSKQYPLTQKSHIDFAFPYIKFAIEADGNYWHSKPHMIKQDKIKNNRLINNGWFVLRLSENEINNNLDSCLSVINFIINSLQNNIYSFNIPKIGTFYNPFTFHRSS